MVGVVLGDWSSGVVMLSDWLGHEEYIKEGVYILRFMRLPFYLVNFFTAWQISSHHAKYLHGMKNFFKTW